MKKNIESKTKMKLNPSEREKEILNLITADPSLTVTKLGRLLEVSSVTVRSDLSSLESQGLIIRARGKASTAFHPEILRRQKSRMDEKKRIARKAASLVEEGDTIIIEAGTTTSLVARYLVGKRNIRIVTNSTLILPYARTNPGIHLSMMGGTFRPETESMVGPAALDQLENFHVRLAFIGTDGFSVENGLSSHFSEAAAVLKKMAERADKVVLVADSSKFGKTGFVCTLPIDAVSMLIVDSAVSDEAVRDLQSHGVEVEIVK
jgi:DeoR family galactitol utilization operon repressor